LFVNRQGDEASVGEDTKGNGGPREKERERKCERHAMDTHARSARLVKSRITRRGIYLLSRKKTRERFFPASGSAGIPEAGRDGDLSRSFLRKAIILDTRAFSLNLSRRV